MAFYHINCYFIWYIVKLERKRKVLPTHFVKKELQRSVLFMDFVIKRYNNINNNNSKAGEVKQSLIAFSNVCALDCD